MVVAGVLLIVVVVVVAVSIVAGGSGAVSFTLLGMTVDTTARGLYVIGLASLLVAVLGVVLVLRGLKRQHRIKKENRTLRREVRHSHDQAPQDQAPQGAGPGYGPGGPGPGPGGPGPGGPGPGPGGPPPRSADDHYRTNPRD